MIYKPLLKNANEISTEHRLPKGPEEIVVQLPSPAQKCIVHVKDFGVDEKNYDNRAHFMAAIDHCKEVKASHLVIDPGIYHIRSGNIVFDGLKDFTVDGNECELIFGKFYCGDFNTCVLIKDCNNFHMKNLIIDWNWKKDPIASRVKILASHEKGEYVDLEFVDETPNRNGVVIKQMHPLHKDNMTIGTNEAQELPSRPFEDAEVTTEEELKTKPDNISWLGKPAKVDFLDDQTIRAYAAVKSFDAPGSDLHKERMTKMIPGSYWLIRHYNWEIYGVYCENSSHVTFEDCIIYSSPGMGFFVHGGHHIQNLNLKVTKRPDSNRYISTASDHYHVHNSQGYILFDGCDFGYGGDDCINIHDEFSVGVTKLDSHRLEALTSWKTPYKKGDFIEFRNSNLSPMNFSASLTETVFSEDKKRCIMSFDRQLPEVLPEDTVLFWRTYSSANYIIRNCYFHENRARGLALHQKNGLIENCRFYHHSAPALQLATGYLPGKWCEGFGIENLVVRNNTFEGANQSCVRKHMPVIHVHTFSPGNMLSKFRIFKDMLFENNRFLSYPGVPLYLTSAQNVTVKDNVFEGGRRPTVTDELHGHIYAEEVGNLWVMGNRWTMYEDDYVAGLYYQDRTVGDVTVFDNDRDYL